jgi:hypothetical protein
MKATTPVMKMPEFLVFGKCFVVGIIGAEVWRIAFYLGANFAPTFSKIGLLATISVLLVTILLCSGYIFMRAGHIAAARITRSLRFDLLVAFGVGIWANVVVEPWLFKAHTKLKNADPQWAPIIFLLLCVIMLSALTQQFRTKSKTADPQMYFIGDEEIEDVAEDLLESKTRAESFAQTVLSSSANKGLVFGVDGPWGVGKTSFLNLAERYWENEGNKVIICRFEPLRYASEPDLADRLIRDLTAVIQRKVFVPEFRSAASRYSRLIKGKAEFSFLGFKLSMEPSQDTVDELLDDIDEVLKRINRHLIIVIDDLDRLDAKAVNNVLFATRRTFKLSQATYILCYDTEVLAESKEESSRAREFLEKFVTVKVSLFVDSSSIRDFLKRDWQRPESQLGSIPSDTMIKLGGILSELADILDESSAANYFPVVGDLRKIKRFVNSMLIMQIDRSELGRTDFNKRDLINLILLHLNYPGLFRRIYAEETEGRSGAFSVHRKYGEHEFKNSEEFADLVKDQEKTAQFLLRQLFDVATLELGDQSSLEETVLASRACFNHESARNLEKYLKLIVRFATPEPQATFILYQQAVEQVRQGNQVASVLSSSDFNLEYGEHSHDQFWRVLVNQSHNLSANVVDDVIDTLLDYLPSYSVIDSDDRGLRQRSIYSLLRLLDRAAWGRATVQRRENSAENIVEIAWRIFGEKSHDGRALIQRLVSSERGVLGWNDLMIFRLYCSMDRQGQLHNLYSALIWHQYPNAHTTGVVSELAIMEMRRLSQRVFALFRETYINQQRNFLAEVDCVPIESLVGRAHYQLNLHASEAVQGGQGHTSISHRISAARTSIKTFVIYQLSNSLPANGSGVGCGYYDEDGIEDGRGISRLMNEYMFGVCFNPDLDENNIFHFLDYCLAHLSNSFFSGRDEDGYFASRNSLHGGLDAIEMGRYWIQHQELIRGRLLNAEEREVVTQNYIAFYSEDLRGVLAVLDEISVETRVVDSGGNRTDSNPL